MKSGAATDALFADGLLPALAASGRCEPTSVAAHWRPVAQLPPPFGSVIGDVGVLLTTPDGGQTLLIVEREGSAPGNERNILKWYEVIRQSQPIVLSGAAGQQLSVDQVHLALVFTQGSGWGTSDFQKTAAFCSSLADLTNAAAVQQQLPFRVTVAVHEGIVTDWTSCGRASVGRVLSQFDAAWKAIRPPETA